MKTKTFALAVTLLAAPVHAQDSIEARLAAAPQGSFEAGAYQTLGAVERLFQSFHRYGIGRGFGRFMGLSGRSLANPAPEPRAPETFRTIVQAFADDLDAARATLAMTDPASAEPFVVDLASLWFDINGNGSRDSDESAVPLVARVMPGRAVRQNLPEGPVEVRFDAADHAWLVAYTHALSAGAEMVLAFDPTPVFADLVEGKRLLSGIPTIPNTYDADALRARIAGLGTEVGELQAELEALRERRRPFEEQQSELMNRSRAATDETERTRIREELTALRERMNEPDLNSFELQTSLRLLSQQIRSAQAKLPVEPGSREAMQREMMARQVEQFGDAADALYALFEVLRRDPDAERIGRAEAHWRAMLASNRQFWTLVAEETDDDREWVPNSSQTSALGLTVDARTAVAWQGVLDDAEALLDGRLLIPHPLLPSDVGINLAAWLDNPGNLDPVGWIHGRAAYPYLARGTRITRETWFALQQATSGNGAAFAIFLN